MGAIARNSVYAADIRSLSKVIAELAQSSFGEFTQGANGAGAWLAGAVPHRGLANGKVLAEGNTAQQMLTNPLKAYLLFGIEPEFDCANPSASLSNLNNADFVVCCSPYMTETMQSYADVILPTVPFTETGGTFVNCNGVWQAFKASNKPLGEARPGWKVLRVLGNFLDVPNFDYLQLEDVTQEIKQAVDVMNVDVADKYQPTQLAATDKLQRLGFRPLYRVDNVVRRSAPLQAADTTNFAAVYINTQLAQQLNLSEKDVVEVQQGEATVDMSVVIDERIADQCVQVFAANEHSTQLGANYGEIEIRRATA